MNSNSASFIFGVLIFALTLTAVAWHFFFRARRSSRLSWESLVQRLAPVDRKIVAAIALDLIEEPGRSGAACVQERLDPSHLWDMIGGMKGLEDLKSNSQILIELATHLQRWYPDAIAIAEELRLDARELEWHIGRLEGAAGTGNLEISFPFYAQRAVATYYRMTRQLLAFYEGKHTPLFVDLQNAL